MTDPKPKVKRIACCDCGGKAWAAFDGDGRLEGMFVLWETAMWRANHRAFIRRDLGRAVVATITGESENRWAPVWRREQDARIAAEVDRAVTHFETVGAGEPPC